MITQKEIDLANEKFNKLYESVERQEGIYPPAVNESIAISQSMVARANGIVKEVAKWKGDLEPLINHGYILEKIRQLVSDYNAMAHDHKIVFGKAPFITEFETGMEEEPLTPEIIKRTNETVFRNIRLDHKDNKLKRVI
jgi:hypothetical protein